MNSQKETKKNKKQEMKMWGQDIMLLYAIIAVLQVIYYIVSVAKGYYHADSTDSLFWAQATYDAGALVNPDFNYAGLMAFAGNVIMLPGIALFGVGLKAQIMGMVIFYCLLMVGLFLLGHVLELSTAWKAALIGSVSFWMSSSEKLREIFWDHIIYYSFGFLLLVYALTATIWLLKKWNQMLEKKRAICSKSDEKQHVSNKILALSLVFAPVFLPLIAVSIISAMNGFQIVVLSVLPVLGAIVMVAFLDMDSSWWGATNCARYIACGVILICVLIGTFLCRLCADGVEAGYENAYSVYSKSDEWMTHVMDVYPAFLRLAGVDGQSDMSMFSVVGIANLVRILCITVVIVIPVVMLLFWRKLLKETERLVVVSHFVCAAVILLGWVFGLLNSAPWRLAPILASCVLCCVLFAKCIWKDGVYKRFAVLVMIPVVLMSALVSVDMKKMEKQTVANKNLTDVAKFLEEHNLEYGYGTFWQSNIITMLSDSKVTVRNIEIDNGAVEQCYYQTNDYWYEDVDEYDQYFILLTNSEYTEQSPQIALLQSATEQLECNDYTILVYDYNIFSPEESEE